ncbi:hypothetical protein GGQ99_005064 [Aminobacter niigataensis]|uniref:Uncharacterized protein n=1 Tax=Aminobacter niigataensis TaxID=83265 RepID=A0ABR6LAM5_9HYPH|nr:hypothetical protein [Aminobacter niigataensis]
MTAVIIPFPTCHREGHIRHVAAVLRRKHGREADRYWRQTVMVLRSQMLRAQVDQSTADEELRRFALEVFARVPLRANNPKGAA